MAALNEMKSTQTRANYFICLCRKKRSRRSRPGTVKFKYAKLWCSRGRNDRCGACLLSQQTHYDSAVIPRPCGENKDSFGGAPCFWWKNWESFCGTPRRESRDAFTLEHPFAEYNPVNLNWRRKLLYKRTEQITHIHRDHISKKPLLYLELMPLCRFNRVA
jgi:hypothetical protein